LLAVGHLQNVRGRTRDGHELMLRGPLHNADGLCEECGEPFPCPTGMAIFEAIKREVEAPGKIHLALTRDELTTIVAVLRANGLHGFADRLEAVVRPPNPVD
jgi:hypothetical protein